MKLERDQQNSWWNGKRSDYIGGHIEERWDLFQAIACPPVLFPHHKQAVRRICRLPWVVGVLADLGGSRVDKPKLVPKFVQVTPGGFETFLHEVSPSLEIPVTLNELGATPIQISLSFQELRDFSPEAIAQNISSLNLDHLPQFKNDRSAEVTKILDQVLHHQKFLTLEGYWRGLHYLVEKVGSDSMMQVRVLNVSWEQLSGFAEEYWGSEFVECPLTKVLTQYPFRPGASEPPFTMLIADFEFDHGCESINTLKFLSTLGAMATIPVVAAVSPALIGLESWSQIYAPHKQDINRVQEHPEFARWRNLRAEPDSRYLVLTAPRVLARPPYQNKTIPMSSGVIEFNESVINCGTVDSSKLCWFNPSYCLAVVAARAFAADGVSLKIQGLESGGRLDNLPIYSSATDDVTPTVIGPAEVLLSDADASFLGSIGLTLLCGRKNSDQAVFGTIRSIQQPQEFFDSESYTRFFREQVNISWVFVEGYFSQRIRLLVRELCPGRQDPRPIQDWLNEFIKPLQIITPQMQMQRPLSDGFIYIDSAPGLPGVNICRLSVTPQIFHQLPDASLISLRFPL